MRYLCALLCALCAGSTAGATPSPDIAALIAATPDGGVAQLPDGEVRLTGNVEIVGRTNVTVRGGAGTVVVLHYSPWDEPVWTVSPRFFVRDCSGVTFENFRVTTDNPVNATGRIAVIDAEGGAYEAEIDPQFPITGWEHIYASDSFDDDGTPDYALATYDYWNVRTETLPDGKGGERKKTIGLAYEVVGPQRIRVKASAAALGRLRVGQRVLYRYTVYGHEVFNIRASQGVALRDIEIERCPSMGVSVAPPSRDFLLERFNMRAPEGDRALYCANADGVHVLGLAGSFTMRDCHFIGLGDDALNIHSKSGEIASFDPQTGALRVICRNTRKKEVALPGRWMAEGDTLAVYDPKTFLEKGRLVVRRFDGGGDAIVVAVEGNDSPGEFVPPLPAVGDYVANLRDMPSVEIDGCSVERTRARGFLLQTRHIRVRDCAFRCLSLPGLILSPDMAGWFEAGPVEDAEISGCTFEKCGMNGAPANLGAITVKTSHGDGLQDCPPGVHRDIRVVGNAFRGCGAAGVFIASARGVEVRGNVFEDCWRKPPKDADPERRNVRLHNCENVPATVAVSLPATVHTVPERCRSALWSVRADGVECGVASARTCDEPFAGWGFRQGGEYAFTSFEMTAPATLQVRSLSPRELDRVKILPEDVPAVCRVIAPDTLEIAVTRPCRFSVEPDGRESPLLVFAEPPLADAPDERDPKVKVFGPGWHDAGRIELGDGETLFLTAGAFVKGGVFAKGDKIRICGYGVLDGTDYPWRKGPVPHVIQLKECRNAIIENIVVRGAYHWTIVPIGSDGVTVRGVKLCGGRVQNDDGVDPCNSRNVLVEDCFFRTDDDCVAVKGTTWGEKYGGVSNVVVRNCTFWSDHARIALMGHESRAPFMREIVFEDCDILRSRLSAFLMEPGEGMRLENVRVRNVRVRDDIGDPAYHVLTLRPCVNEYMKDKTPGHIADCSFENVSVTCNRTEGLFLLQGHDEAHKVKNIVISGARLNGNPVNAGDPTMRIGSFTENVEVWP